MAFFGVTQLGYQDTIREHMREPEYTPQYVYRSGLYREALALGKLPPIHSKDNDRQPSVVPIDATSGYGAGHRGSHKEFVRMKYKNVRNPQEITQEYRRPVTTGQEIAKWRVDEPLKVREPWSYTKRHIHVNSEMVKFVKDMSLTNREFSLF